MLVIFIFTYFLPNHLHKVQPVRLTGGFLEGEDIITCLYIGIQGVSEVEGILWRRLGSFFMVKELGCKYCCFWENGLGERHGHIFKEVNEAKYLWYAISVLV